MPVGPLRPGAERTRQKSANSKGGHDGDTGDWMEEGKPKIRSGSEMRTLLSQYDETYFRLQQAGSVYGLLTAF